MSLKFSLGAAALTLAFALPAFAAPQISIEDPYAIASGVGSVAGAAFFTIENTGDEDDRLIAAESDAAKRVELHTHILSADGVARMVEVKEGFPVPAGAGYTLARGGDHVMFMGLTQPFEQGKTVHVTLVFEKSGRIELDVPVDLTRAAKAMPGMNMDAGGDGMDMDEDDSSGMSN